MYIQVTVHTEESQKELKCIMSFRESGKDVQFRTETQFL